MPGQSSPKCNGELNWKPLEFTPYLVFISTGYSNTEGLSSLKKCLERSSKQTNKAFMIFNSYETPGNFYQYFIINTEVETSVVSQESRTWSWISYVEYRITRWTCHKSFTVKFTVILCWPEFKLLLQAQESSLIPVHNLGCCLRVWVSFYSVNKYSWKREASPSGMQHWYREGIVMFTGLPEERK